MSSPSARDDSWYAKAAFGVLSGDASCIIFARFRSDIGALARRALLIADLQHQAG
jgi:hypothetical protein